ncbi:MAG: hypothetical protein R3B84_12690 [Zavarzinella sp.]
MKGILLLSRSMIVIFAFACLFAGESAVQAQPKVPVVERFAGKVPKSTTTH